MGARTVETLLWILAWWIGVSILAGACWAAIGVSMHRKRDRQLDRELDRLLDDE